MDNDDEAFTLGYFCQCDKDLSKVTVHVCDKCKSGALCCDMTIRPDRYRWCAACQSSWLATIENDLFNPSLRMIWYCLRSLLALDARNCTGVESMSLVKVDPDLEKGCRDSIQQIKSDSSLLSWYNAYNSINALITARLRLEPAHTLTP